MVALDGGRPQGVALLGQEAVTLHGKCWAEGRDCLSEVVNVLGWQAAIPVRPHALGYLAQQLRGARQEAEAEVLRAAA